MLFQDGSAYACAGQDEAEDQASRAAADDTAARSGYGSVHMSNLCAPEVSGNAVHSCTLSLPARAADILPFDKLHYSLDECGWKRTLVLQQPTLGLQMVARVRRRNNHRVHRWPLRDDRG